VGKKYLCESFDQLFERRKRKIRTTKTNQKTIDAKRRK